MRLVPLLLGRTPVFAARHLKDELPGWELSQNANLSGLIDSLMTAQHPLEIYGRNVIDPSARRLLDRLANRIVKILTQTKKLKPPKIGQRLAG